MFLLIFSLAIVLQPPPRSAAQQGDLTLPTVSATIFPGRQSPLPGNVVPAPNSTGFSPFSLAVDTSNGLVYAPTQSSAGTQGLVVINSSYSSRVQTVPVPLNNTFPHQSAYGAFNPKNGYVYVADYGAGAVSVYNGADGHLVDIIHLGTWTYGVLFVRSTGLLYAVVSGNYPGSGSGVFVVNATNDEVITQVKVGTDPGGIAYDPENGLLFVANYGTWTGPNGSISVVDTRNDSVVHTIGFPTGSYYTYMQNVFVASDGYLYALAFDYWGGQHAASTWYKIDPNDFRILSSVPAAIADSNSGQISQDPLGRVYVPSGNFIQVFDPVRGKFIGNITAGLETTDVVYDPFTADMLATNLVSGTISVIPTGAAPLQVQEVTMNESGLAPGTSWGVGNGTILQSTNETGITYALPPGSYQFSTEGPDGYSTQAVGFTVADAPLSVTIRFSLAGPTTTATTSTTSTTPAVPSTSDSGAQGSSQASLGTVQVATAALAVVAAVVLASVLLRRAGSRRKASPTDLL